MLFRAVAIVALLLCGCSKQEAPPMLSGANISNVELALTMQGAWLPDEGYSVVNTAWLKAFYEEFRADLFAKDVVGWEGRFDCNKFAAAYASAVQMRFYRDQFHSRNKAQAAAVGEVWYMSSRGAHAINIALTEAGTIFIEPQTGQFVSLTPQEVQSIRFIRF